MKAPLEGFSSTNEGSVHDAGIMSELIWIASYPRSGNTWLRALLANYVYDVDQPVPINGLAKFSAADGFLSYYEYVTGRRPATLSDSDLLRLRERVHRWLSSASKYRVLVKTHNANVSIQEIDLFTSNLPQKAIYIVRHPFDVAISYAAYLDVIPDEARDVLSQEDYVSPRTEFHAPQFLRSWSRHVDSWVRQETMEYLLVRYEDLYHTPHETLCEIARFLQLAVRDTRINKAVAHSSFQTLSAQEQIHGFKEASAVSREPFFRQGRPSTAAERCAHPLFSKIVFDHRSAMKRVGYL